MCLSGRCGDCERRWLKCVVEEKEDVLVYCGVSRDYFRFAAVTAYVMENDAIGPCEVYAMRDYSNS
jgi:hypothetical protein